MLQYTIRRLIGMIPIIFLISIVVFTLAKLMPGDALSGKIDPLNSDPEYIEEMREKMGLNDPIHTQYFRWIGGVVQGDFGDSFIHKRDVMELIGDRLPNTVFLGFTSLMITYILAFMMGRFSGRFAYSPGDYLISGINYLALAIPSFVAALVAIYVFSFQLGWVPATGSIGSGVEPGSFEYYLSKIKHTILPALVLGTMATAGYTQFLRNDMIESSRKDYVRTARAKGTKESAIYNKHILRNSVIPIITLLGFDIAGLFGGAIITETIFTYPGIGYLFVESVNSRDYSVMMAITMMLTILTLIGNLVADILYGIVDPRIRLS
ncbi:ABC transporter permease [Bacillus infantis]|jgi:peptide/nickel transport system permease protein|uniref:Peptide ABC transporter permease n=2 Tax=Bacillus infantis TaxID=324767 RepID=U5L7W3_9BACI|nr:MULTISPECIES: oligopeptide ABC transporter permease [Bacillus]OXT17361.1 peptide ABC transporter permease [Bacillus sp. OG2]AGX03448.1 peptide ABC transporter permease [Bacillus infantis NRRL B-14911]MCA1034295.1 ABC transporter permease [Bacillus infantis]MCA1039523.1 ABC transporter permease [Bacillus infantis]MCK6204258.1 ABC transporter permease [Bacillus infantis]